MADEQVHEDTEMLAELGGPNWLADTIERAQETLATIPRTSWPVWARHLPIPAGGEGEGRDGLGDQLAATTAALARVRDAYIDLAQGRQRRPHAAAPLRIDDVALMRAAAPAPALDEFMQYTPDTCPYGPHRGPAGPNEDLAQCPACLSPSWSMRPAGETYGDHLADCALPQRHAGPCRPGGDGHSASGHVRGFFPPSDVGAAAQG